VAHVRKQIRDAAATLVTGLTTTGSNVFKAQIYNLQESQLPALKVYTPVEAIELEAGTLDAPDRALSLIIEGVAQATSGLEDTLDLIATEVEVALGADVTVGGLSRALDLSETVKQISAEGDPPIGSVLLTYNVKYRTPFGDPETVA